MNVIDVHCNVREYPDEEQPYQTLIVRNHWNRKDMVVLEIDGKRYTFIAHHLKKAIDNAQNAH